jgi:hypothetical protein
MWHLLKAVAKQLAASSEWRVQQDCNPVPHELARHEPRTRHFSPSAFHCFGACPFALTLDRRTEQVSTPQQCSSVSILSSLCVDRTRNRSSSPGRGKDILFSSASKLALGPTHPSVEWVPGPLTLGVRRPGHETHHVLPNLIMRGAIPPFAYLHIFMVWSLIKHRDNFASSI